MPITYAGVTGKVELSGGYTGLPLVLSFIPQTTKNALTFDGAGGGMQIGPVTVETDDDGNLPALLDPAVARIPTNADQNDGAVLWKVTAQAKVDRPGISSSTVLTLGTVPITTNVEIGALLKEQFGVTVVNGTLIIDIQALAASAAANAATAETAAATATAKASEANTGAATATAKASDANTAAATAATKAADATAAAGTATTKAALATTKAGEASASAGDAAASAGAASGAAATTDTVMAGRVRDRASAVSQAIADGFVQFLDQNGDPLPPGSVTTIRVNTVTGQIDDITFQEA